jgi:hypothetical protein
LYAQSQFITSINVHHVKWKTDQKEVNMIHNKPKQNCSKLQLNKKTLALLAGSLSTTIATTTYAQPCDVDKLPDASVAGHIKLGGSICIDQSTIIVGAYEDSTQDGNSTGSAFIYTLANGAWTEQAKLEPVGGSPFDQFAFGWSVSISGDTAVVGTPDDGENSFFAGSAYVFTRTGNVWSLQEKLLPPEVSTSDNFGYSVSISGDTIVVGAYGDDDIDDDTGAAYVFTRTGGTWTLEQKLVANDAARFDRFGNSVSINGDSVIIGAAETDTNGDESGSAYVFTRTAGTWTQQDKLLPNDGAEDDEFGTSVSINNDSVIIGAYLDDDNGSSSGSAYVFTRTAGAWTQQDKLLANDGSGGDRFGASVSISGDSTIIGAWGDNNDNGSDAGSAYVFTDRELMDTATQNHSSNRIWR